MLLSHGLTSTRNTSNSNLTWKSSKIPRQHIHQQMLICWVDFSPFAQRLPTENTSLNISSTKLFRISSLLPTMVTYWLTHAQRQLLFSTQMLAALFRFPQTVLLLRPSMLA